MSDSPHPLITEKLTMHFGGLAALEDIDLAVERDTTHAIIGPNGAGKSTFLQLPDGAAASYQRAYPAGGPGHHGPAA